MATTKSDLFRALNGSDFAGEFQVDGIAADGLLYPRFVATTYTNNNGEERTSQADVDFQENPDTGALEVQPGGGTSLFDVAGWFGFAAWKYFQIPLGTEYSDGLYLRKSKNRRKNKAKTLSGFHYQIEPKNPMTAGALKGALDTFARNAVVRSIQLSQAKEAK